MPADRGDDVGRRRDAMVLDAGGHLRGMREPHPDRAHARQPLRPALADQRRDRARVPSVAGGASSTLNATSGSRADTSTAPAVGCSRAGP